MEELTAKMNYYSYYREAYGAVLDGLVGQYEIQIPSQNAPLYATPALLPDGSQDPDKVWVKKYGLKGFSPIAKNFPYNDFDDFGVARSYGYRRQHLGHDMMGQVGTPVIAVESGYVEAIGWNQYGGWRLGIRSFDGKRYYYYAHLRKNYPYHKSLSKGSIVTAGDVIGYLAVPDTAGMKIPIILMNPISTLDFSSFLMSLRRKGTTRSGSAATS